MRVSKIIGLTVATFISVVPVAVAQTQAPTQTKDSTANTTQTFTGCLMTEPAYRKAHNLGDGALSGLGLGDEFVLVDVKVSAAMEMTNMSKSSDGSSKSAVSASGGTSTCADRGVAYRLTGSAEDKLKTFVGHQLEVQGRFKHADDVNANGTPTSGKLPAEVEIVSYREAPSAMPVNEPAVTPVPEPRPVMPPQQTAPPPPMRMQPTPPPSTPPVNNEPRELPRTAGTSPLLALVGLIAIGGGIASIVLRRRMA